MLKEIYCDKFISNGSIRKPIQFKKGLNSVIGTDSGKNSIGKSTFLMIIDFVYGGRDYITLCKDVQDNVKTHVIKWKFEFNSEIYSFSRSTGNSLEVNICDEDYNIKAQISLDKYCKFLAEKYEIATAYSTFRETAGLFFRVFDRPTIDNKYPLTMAQRENLSAGINRLLKIFGNYAEIDRLAKYRTAIYLQLRSQIIYR